MVILMVIQALTAAAIWMGLGWTELWQVVGARLAIAAGPFVAFGLFDLWKLFAVPAAPRAPPRECRSQTTPMIPG